MSSSNTELKLFGVGLALAITGYFVYAELQKKKKSKKFQVVFVLGGPGAGKVKRRLFL